MVTDISDINIPLTTDLDGTLIHTDTLAESFMLMIKKKPLLFFLFPLWLLKGKYYLKAKILEHSNLKAESLPYNQDVIKFLEEEKAKGRKIYLFTASMQKIADKVQEHLGIFDAVYGSSDNVNLRSANKLSKLNQLFGEKNFDYIGDSGADIKVWQGSRKGYAVNPSKKIEKKIQELNNVEVISRRKKSTAKLIIKEIRVYQWVKNVLIFLPVLLAHKIPDFSTTVSLIIAFFSFSLMASFIYVINDIFDIAADRQHRKKKFRPIASGELSLFKSFIILPLLAILSLGLSIAFLSHYFTLLLLVYLIINITYSFYAKKIMVLDIIILSILYTIRLIGGGIVADVLISPWLLEFSIFIFLSLAAIKRFSELYNLKQLNKDSSARRGYRTEDIDLIRNIGVISGYISVLIIGLYLNSTEVITLYKRPQLLWIITPLLLYWITRLWMVANRGLMNEDPIIFTIRDKASYIIGLSVFLIAIGATI